MGRDSISPVRADTAREVRMGDERAVGLRVLSARTRRGGAKASLTAQQNDRFQTKQTRSIRSPGGAALFSLHRM